MPARDRDCTNLDKILAIIPFEFGKNFSQLCRVNINDDFPREIAANSSDLGR
jgi:hypothetical protein